MLERPAGVEDGEVLAVVRREWAPGAEAIEHLRVGFGAHHWRAGDLFVTLDELGVRHDAGSLEGAYRAAAALRLEFAVAPLPALGGTYTVAFGEGRLSCTPWLAGEVAGDGPIEDEALARADIEMLARLHAATPPPTIPRWRPRVGPDVADRIAAAVATRWDSGPLGEPAREAIAARLEEIGEWSRRYRARVAEAPERPWVPTHGEPHSSNQLLTADGPRFVDWESLALAPRERDLWPLVEAGYAQAVRPDPAMLDLFDLEWRLDEIAQYGDWFAAEHSGSEDDRIAFDGLRFELERPAR
jgi:spectinomycin phosphotransferase